MYLIGTDIGTLGTKSILVDVEGTKISAAFREYGVLTPKPGWAEQWPDVWFDAVCETIRSLISQSKVKPEEILGVCISGLYGGSGIPCDKQMKPLRPCIIWADRRAGKECEEVKSKISVDEIFKITGNIVDPYFGYTKMLWIKNNEPKIWNRISQMVTPNAYCIYKLTGQISIDYSSAGNYGGIYNIRKNTWSEEMMQTLGIPREFFPEKIYRSKDVVGEVTRDGERLTGLKRGTPVCAGGIDAPVSALSVGALQDGDAAIMLGTSMCNGFISNEQRLSPKMINYPYVANDPETQYSFSGLLTAGYCIRWFRDNLAKHDAKIAEELGQSAYAMLDQEAEKIPPGSEGLIFLPHMMIGERAPYWDNYVSGAVFGLTIYHTKAHLFRAFLEGVAYALRYSLETSKEAGIIPRRCILVDGGAKSKLWRKIISDVTGMKMIYIKNAPGAPLGDALLAGVGTKAIDDFEAIQNWLEATETTEPDPYNKKIYDESYKLFREIEKNNAEIYRRLISMKRI
ncbi:MAG: FGGY-family carbohydrate kinase [Nitrososphaerota archaeon]|nr:FGGY-family carbohydrate kinase [Candidatus Bathyarchaeota archaeon]MDW8048261.1 FGGY-family carbohydrate kinase [Nitrososphaerota archaeon]